MSPAIRTEPPPADPGLPSGFDEAVQRTAALYSADSRFAAGYVRGKLRGDPVFRQLVERAPFAEPLVDLGCGRGQTELLLTLLLGQLEAQGFDWDEAKVRLARQAAARSGCGAKLRFEVGDLRTLEYPPAGTVLMLDVLHYNPLAVQDDMLRRAARCLQPGGRLFVREVDAAGGLRARLNILQERVCCFFGLNRGATLCFRSADSIEAVLRDEGLFATRGASWQGTVLANVLIEARRGGP
jgi:SAM-dependent methyltransferase